MIFKNVGWQNHEWIGECLGVTPSDRWTFTGLELLRTDDRQPYKLEILKRCYKNIHDIQKCATISSGLSPYLNGDYDETWIYRSKGITYSPHWESSSQTYTGWDSSPYDWNTPYHYVDETGSIEYELMVTVSKEMTSYVWQKPHQSGQSEPQYDVMYQEEPSVEYSHSDQWEHDGTTKTPYMRGLCRTVTGAGNHDRLNKIEAVALIEIQFWKNRTRKTWNNETKQYDNINNYSNGTYYVVAPITLTRTVKPTSSTDGDPKFDHVSEWAWTIDGASNTKSFFRSIITTEDVLWDDDYEENIKLIETPDCPEVEATQEYYGGRSNRNSGYDQFVFRVYQIAVRIEWDYTSTFQ